MSAPGVIRVLIADDHVIVRKGLLAIVEDAADLAIVGEANDGGEAVDLYERHRPDVTLMDLRMPGLGGLDALARIRGKFTDARVVLLTTFDDEEDIFRGLEGGAWGYLLKDAAPDELVASIRRVHAGKRAIAPEVAAKLADRVGMAELSDREQTVLRLLATGQSNKQIARALAIAEGTVKAHVASILEKLGAQGRTEAVAIALRRGLVRLQ